MVIENVSSGVAGFLDFAIVPIRTALVGRATARPNTGGARRIALMEEAGGVSVEKLLLCGEPQAVETKAMEMIRAAQSFAARSGLAVSVAVVDESGRAIAMGRMDEAQPRTMELAYNKAYTAARFHVPSAELVQQAVGEIEIVTLLVRFQFEGRLKLSGSCVGLARGRRSGSRWR